MTSHDVVNFIRRNLEIKKAGHTGTLDPGAAGVLLICLGKATRLAGFLGDDDKEYRAEITFGLATSSGDSFGEVTCEKDASGLNEDEVRSALALFHGEITQIPPMTSAVKIKGKKLYELARAGLTIDRPGRVVNIKSLEFICGGGWGTPHPRALLQLSCSKGTYVRTLCLDIGERLGCGAHMSFLVRTGIGPYKVADALTLEEIKILNMKNTLIDKVINIDQALSWLPAVLVKEGAVQAVLSGTSLYLPGVALLPPGLNEKDLVRLVGPDGFLAVAETLVDPQAVQRVIFKPVCVLPR
jgi:tRNA pseudouridine55 synthase